MPNDLILLVDDELSIIQLSQMYLEREGYRVDSVRDGESALSAVERLHPAVVVLDVMRPKLDGFEVCRRLRASQTDTAILMLTARNEDIDKILGLELGADDYLTKPFNPRELVARVKAILAPLVLGGVVVGGWFAHRWLRTDVGRQWLDSAKLTLPFIGGILHLFGLSQFVRSLATLLAGGTPMVEALETATSVVTNRAIGTPLARVAPRVREGQALWSSLTATGLFPELSLAMIQVGEATGALEEMLFNVGQFYDETIEVKLARVVTLIEPAVLVLMGGLIGILLLSVYVPMFRMIQYAR